MGWPRRSPGCGSPRLTAQSSSARTGRSATGGRTASTRWRSSARGSTRRSSSACGPSRSTLGNRCASPTSSWSGRLETFFTARAKHLPHLARRLAGARIVAPVGAMGPLAYEVDVPRVGGVLLVGDAAGFVDPFTGEGIYAALRGAELAVETAVGALRSGDCSRQALAAYRRARRLAFGGKARVTRALQFVISHRGLANLTAHVLAQRPGLLDVLLGVIGDFVPPKALVTGLVR